jgi:hypothetical protein
MMLISSFIKIGPLAEILLAHVCMHASKHIQDSIKPVFHSEIKKVGQTTSDSCYT